MFSTQTYITRRQKLKKSISGGIVLFLGNEEVGMNYRDNAYRFRQDSSFLYFFGISQPSLAAIIDIDAGEEIIFGDEFCLDDIIWAGPQVSLAERAQRIGIYRIETADRLASKIKDIAASGRKIHFLPPYRAANKIKLSNLLNQNIVNIDKLVSTELIEAIVAQRSKKSSEEILQIEEAINISREMHLIAMKNTAVGKKEYEIVAAIQAKALECGGDIAYPIIFTENGQTLHNHYHGNTMQAGRLVLNDSGAENAMFYAGDITRTFPVNKKFNSQQKDIYNLVLAMQNAAIHAMKPNIQYREIHLLANRVMLEGLKAMGILQGDIDEMLLTGVQGLFMPHGLGHAIGLDVHDMEALGEDFVGYRAGIERSTALGLKSLRFAKELSIGNVMTVEPGIYFIPELINKWQKEGKFLQYINYQKLDNFKNFGGIRIEDNCLITAQGSQILGKYIPKTIEEVEAACN